MTQAYDPPTDPIRVIHADTSLLIVDKPAGLLSVPGKGPHLADCLLTRLELCHPGTLLVHRLDRDTSGVMVFARTRAAQRHLGLQFERRHLSKRYIALVAGWPAAETGRIDLPLAADWPNRPRQRVDRDHGRSAVTDWTVIRRLAEGTTWMSLSPLTGRSHQLRVHMLELGCPIVGDPLYGDRDRCDAARLMLHAESLTLRHPEGGAAVTYAAPDPFRTL